MFMSNLPVPHPAFKPERRLSGPLGLRRHTLSYADLVEGVGFEPTKAEPADLQSAPVDHLGTPPEYETSTMRGSEARCQVTAQCLVYAKAGAKYNTCSRKCKA